MSEKPNNQRNDRLMAYITAMHAIHALFGWEWRTGYRLDKNGKVQKVDEKPKLISKEEELESAKSKICEICKKTGVEEDTFDVKLNPNGVITIRIKPFEPMEYSDVDETQESR